ncbi:hypothetical protein BELL_0656g00060 [Botrytis elliptica]|uniref:Uncharacterized protein n=1 Tax=Botrytis elliptica TaxID=278938 RepID=A0A4Z1JC83_9HELO|nr:hypothetical protein BELL_0656g00060 [Botrytis elliptica]
MLLYLHYHLPIYQIARLYIKLALSLSQLNDSPPARLSIFKTKTNVKEYNSPPWYFRTIDNIATGTNPEDRVKKLEAQVAQLQKTVDDLQKRLVEMEKSGDVEELDLMKILEQAGFDTKLPEEDSSTEKPEELQME